MASGRVSCGVEAIGRLASVRYRWFVCVPIRCWQEVRRVEGDSRTCSDRAIWYNSCSGWISVYRLVGPVPFGYAVALVRLSPQTRRPAHVGVVCYVSSVTSFCGGEGAVMPNIIPSVFGRLCIGRSGCGGGGLVHGAGSRLALLRYTSKSLYFVLCFFAQSARR